MKKIIVLCLFLICNGAVVPSSAQIIWVNRTDKGSSVVPAKKISNEVAPQLSHTLLKENLDKPSKLFSSGFKAIKTIRQAEEEYAKTHKHYTAVITDLGLNFKDVGEQFFVNGTSRIYLKNGIYYVLTDKLVAVYFDRPTKEEQLYHLDFYFDGTQQCTAKAPHARKTCEQLGGTNPRPNSRIKSWIIYDLPSNFLN